MRPAVWGGGGGGGSGAVVGGGMDGMGIVAATVRVLLRLVRRRRRALSRRLGLLWPERLRQPRVGRRGGRRALEASRLQLGEGGEERLRVDLLQHARRGPQRRQLVQQPAVLRHVAEHALRKRAAPHVLGGIGDRLQEVTHRSHALRALLTHTQVHEDHQRYVRDAGRQRQLASRDGQRCAPSLLDGARLQDRASCGVVPRSQAGKAV